VMQHIGGLLLRAGMKKHCLSSSRIILQAIVLNLVCLPYLNWLVCLCLAVLGSLHASLDRGIRLNWISYEILGGADLS